MKKGLLTTALLLAALAGQTGRANTPRTAGHAAEAATVETESHDNIGDRMIAIASATADSEQPGEGIERTFDGDPATLWSVDYSGCEMPTTITYTMKKPSHIDYMVYTPRTNHINGLFGEISVSYMTGKNTTWTHLADVDCGMSQSPTFVDFGTNGVGKVTKVKIEIKTADGPEGVHYATCAEMAFYEKDRSLDAYVEKYFTSPICTALRPGVTRGKVNRIQQPVMRKLASELLEKKYSTEFRVGEFECYMDRDMMPDVYKTSARYDLWENPTGIYFKKDEKVVIFAEGIDEKFPVQLCIKCFSNEKDIKTEGQPESYYRLKNGVNIIQAKNRGNGYVSYFSENYKNAPKVKLHFAMATESGYFDANRHTNADYVRLLNKAESDIFDILTPRMHCCAPVDKLKKFCPDNAERLAKILDEVVRQERYIMGLPATREEMKNHQVARPAAGGMWADNIGAGAEFNWGSGWVNINKFDFWGLGHELGHNNQIKGFGWSGCGETTNNIYAVWVEHKVGAADAYGTGFHRMEDERTGINDYRNTAGGRMQAYLEEGVRKGTPWQRQEGPDYFGTKPDTAKVKGFDADGKFIGEVKTDKRNYDHFVKLIPFYQMELYTEDCGAAVGAFGRFIESYRKGFDFDKHNTNGKKQIEMVRRLCHAAKINFIPFLEKAGICKPIHAYVEDYAPGWNIITEEMIAELKAEIESKGYPVAPATLHFINAYNAATFRDKAPMAEVETNLGCERMKNGNVKVSHNVWKNVVGFETYNSKNELIRLTLFGLDDTQRPKQFTSVLFPEKEDASYIMAVGYDGKRTKCFEK